MTVSVGWGIGICIFLLCAYLYHNSGDVKPDISEPVYAIVQGYGGMVIGDTNCWGHLEVRDNDNDVFFIFQRNNSDSYEYECLSHTCFTPDEVDHLATSAINIMKRGVIIDNVAAHLYQRQQLTDIYNKGE